LKSFTDGLYLNTLYTSKYIGPHNINKARRQSITFCSLSYRNMLLRRFTQVQKSVTLPRENTR